MASHALETLILLFLFNITPYMEDRRGPLAPDSGLIGPGWGGDCSQSSYKLCSVFRGGRSEYPFYTAYPFELRLAIRP